MWKLSRCKGIPEKETFAHFGHDVFLHKSQLRRLQAHALPAGTEVTLDVDWTTKKPQAYNLRLRESETEETRCHDEVLRQMRFCEYGLHQFEKSLRNLKKLLELEGRSGTSFEALKSASSVLKCSKCQQDERRGANVLLLLEEAGNRWAEGSHPCHVALTNALSTRLSAPPVEPVALSIKQLRFTQTCHSKRFIHGPHAGQRIDWLVSQLETGQVLTSDPSMVLNVVFYHGNYRSLNNRHLVALVQYGDCLESRNLLPSKGFVRVWPLVRGLELDDGSHQDVVRKFLQASDTQSEGKMIERTGKSEATEVNQTVRLHVSNLDFSVSEEDLGLHLDASGIHCPFQVDIHRRADGRSNGYGRLTFKTPADAQHALNMSIPALRGRQVQLKLDEAVLTGEEKSNSPSTETGESFMCCKKCHERCAPLADVLLVEDVRLARKDVPARKFAEQATFLCIGIEASVFNQVSVPHPDSERMPFKIAQVSCRTCQSDLGNIQNASAMHGNWAEKLGERVMHFKCDSVVLELSDCHEKLLEIRKWRMLGAATGQELEYRLSQLSLAEAKELSSRPVKTHKLKLGSLVFFMPLWYFVILLPDYSLCYSRVEELLDLDHHGSLGWRAPSWIRWDRNRQWS